MVKVMSKWLMLCSKGGWGKMQVRLNIGRDELKLRKPIRPNNIEMSSFLGLNVS